MSRGLFQDNASAQNGVPVVMSTHTVQHFEEGQWEGHSGKGSYPLMGQEGLQVLFMVKKKKRERGLKPQVHFENTCICSLGYHARVA